mgnify:CR=1 FL=1
MNLSKTAISLSVFWEHFKQWAEITDDHVYKPKFVKFLNKETGFTLEEIENYFNKALENGHIYHCCGKYYGVNRP